MCIAIDEMRKESKQEGRQEGRREGFEEALASLVKKGLISITDAAKEAGLTPAEFQAKTAKMKR